MPSIDDRHLAGLAAQLEREDPLLARALSADSPRPPRASPRRNGWLLLAAAVAVMAIAVTLGQGLLFATGLVMSGVAEHLLATPQDRRRPTRSRRSRPAD